VLVTDLLVATTCDILFAAPPPHKNKLLIMYLNIRAMMIPICSTGTRSDIKPVSQVTNKAFPARSNVNMQIIRAYHMHVLKAVTIQSHLMWW